jgi:hypothetical protein
MEKFKYKVRANRYVAECGLEIHRGKNSTIVIITELPDNPGMSICNAFEDLFLQVVEAYNLDPERIMWIEHWEIWKVSEGAPYDREEEDWHRVEFDWDGDRATNPRWSFVTASFVRSAIAVIG